METSNTSVFDWVKHTLITSYLARLAPAITSSLIQRVIEMNV